MKRFLISVFLVLVFVGVSIAKDVEIGLEWDANTEENLAGYGAYVGDAAGGPYTKFDEVATGTEEVWWTYDAVLGTSVIKYFVVDAFSTEGLRSGYSNEVNWTYDMMPIVAATEFAGVRDGDEITFSWKQEDIVRVAKWKLFVKEGEVVEYTELAEIEYTGQAGPQYSTTETMTVPDGEIKMFTFALVTFTINGVNSPDSNAVIITIDKRPLTPVYNLKITIKVE